MALKWRAAITGLKLAGLGVAIGCAFAWWFTVPILDKVRPVAWHALGLLTAAAFGAIGVLITRKWLYVGAAESIGLIIGAAYAESSIADYNMGWIESLRSVIVSVGYVILLPGIAALLAGAFITHIGLNRKKKYQSKESSS